MRPHASAALLLLLLPACSTSGTGAQAADAEAEVAWVHHAMSKAVVEQAEAEARQMAAKAAEAVAAGAGTVKGAAEPKARVPHEVGDASPGLRGRRLNDCDMGTSELQSCGGRLCDPSANLPTYSWTTGYCATGPYVVLRSEGANCANSGLTDIFDSGECRSAIQALNEHLGAMGQTNEVAVAPQPSWFNMQRDFQPPGCQTHCFSHSTKFHCNYLVVEGDGDTSAGVELIPDRKRGSTATQRHIFCTWSPPSAPPYPPGEAPRAPPQPPTPPPYPRGDSNSTLPGWFLGNYPNHVIGEAPDYCNTEYAWGQGQGASINCQETCAQHRGAIATGARFVCNKDYGSGCDPNQCVAGAPDGYDFPAGAPGGANTHCMTMVYDVDGDTKPDIVSCTDVGTIKYISDAGNNGWVGYTNQNAGNWQQMQVADLDWDFAHAFNEACVIKDCTHQDILTCVAGNPGTGAALGSGCKSITNLAIQCYCELPSPSPSPPSLPTSPASPPPPPVACETLVQDGGACGPANNGAICRGCCSVSTQTCGTDDGSGPWCGALVNLPEFSLAKLEIAGDRRCPPKHVIKFQPPQCFVNPATCHKHCMSVQVGHSINDDDDRIVAKAKNDTYNADCKANPQMCESIC